MTESQAIHQKTPNKATVQAVKNCCRAIIAHLRLDLTIDAQESERTIIINLSGPDRSILLSKSASLLNSLEYILNKMFGLDKNGSPGLILDSDQYRKHREAELVLLAQMAGTKVVLLRKPIKLQPMTARERRIIHLALAGIKGIRSQSDGQGDNRSVTIYPC